MSNMLIKKVIDFRDKRNWKQYHNPKDLAISISLEASELLENFQWSTSEEAVAKKRDLISEELADVMVYCVLLADALGLDIEQVILSKLDKNDGKYPVEKSYGKKDKYTEL